MDGEVKAPNSVASENKKKFFNNYFGIDNNQNPNDTQNDFGTKVQKHPVPKIDYNSRPYRDGYKINNSKANLGMGRLNWLIDEYGVWDDGSNYSQGYLAYINPNDYIDLTVGNQTTRDNVFKDSDKLDLERMNNEGQTPFIMIDFDNMKVTGHEGRHRLASLAKAGVQRVPVVVRNTSKKFDKRNVEPKILNGIIRGQRFAKNRKGDDKNVSLSLIPLNYNNYEKLIEEFTK